MLKQISNVSSTLIINSYEGFYANGSTADLVLKDNIFNGYMLKSSLILPGAFQKQSKQRFFTNQVIPLNHLVRVARFFYKQIWEYTILQVYI